MEILEYGNSARGLVLKRYRQLSWQHSKQLVVIGYYCLKIIYDCIRISKFLWLDNRLTLSETVSIDEPAGGYMEILEYGNSARRLVLKRYRQLSWQHSKQLVVIGYYCLKIIYCIRISKFLWLDNRLTLSETVSIDEPAGGYMEILEYGNSARRLVLKRYRQLSWQRSKQLVVIGYYCLKIIYDCIRISKFLWLDNRLTLSETVSIDEPAGGYMEILEYGNSARRLVLKRYRHLSWQHSKQLVVIGYV